MHLKMFYGPMEIETKSMISVGKTILVDNETVGG